MTTALREAHSLSQIIPKEDKTMKYVRIKSYYQDGKFTGCEHAYIGDDKVKALERFNHDYPEHNKCIPVAETIDDEDAEWLDWFRIARTCGCVHFFK